MELTDKNYYDKASSLEYLSVSLFKEFMKCEAAAYAELKGEWLPERDETPLLVGNYIHSYFESPEAHEAFLDCKDAKGVSNRDKMLNKRIKKEKVLKKDFKVADTLIERMAGDNNFMQLYGAGDKEVIVTGEINGIKWKGKIDSLRLDLGKFFDIKTNKDLHGKNWVFKDGRNLPTTFVEAYGYHLQMALYRELIFQQFGVSCEPVIFGVSKQDPPELMTIHFETEEMQDLLYDGLATIQEYQEHIKAVIDGKEEPRGCGMCDYCRSKSSFANNIYGALDIPLR